MNLSYDGLLIVSHRYVIMVLSDLAWRHDKLDFFRQNLCRPT